MLELYRVVLLVCLVAALVLVVRRCVQVFAQSRRGERPSRGRLLNEWAWTLVPLLVLAALLWRGLY